MIRRDQRWTTLLDANALPGGDEDDILIAAAVTASVDVIVTRKPRRFRSLADSRAGPGRAFEATAAECTRQADDCAAVNRFQKSQKSRFQRTVSAYDSIMAERWLSEWPGQNQAVLCSGMADGEKRPVTSGDLVEVPGTMRPKLLSSGVVTCSGDLGMLLVHRQDKHGEVDPVACMFWRAGGPTSGGIVQHLHVSNPDEAFKIGAGFCSGLLS